MSREPAFELVGEPYETVYWCPLCGAEIAREQMPDPRLGRRAMEHHNQTVMSTEEAADHHLVRYHPWRYRLWQRFKWNWLIGV